MHHLDHIWKIILLSLSSYLYQLHTKVCWTMNLSQVIGDRIFASFSLPKLISNAACYTNFIINIQNVTGDTTNIVLSCRTGIYLNLIYWQAVLEIWREIMLLTLFAYNLLASGMLNIKADKKKWLLITEQVENIYWVEQVKFSKHPYISWSPFSKSFGFARFRLCRDLNAFKIGQTCFENLIQYECFYITVNAPSILWLD